MRRHCLTCRAVIASGSYCATCRLRNGSTRRWREIRAWVLARDRSTCTACGEPATNVDHLVAVREGGSDDPRNLRSLCAPCHADAHRSIA
jgi:5-methylcytosine-specific restriction endonuclease McrA